MDDSIVEFMEKMSTFASASTHVASFIWKEMEGCVRNVLHIGDAFLMLRLRHFDDGASFERRKTKMIRCT